MSSKEVEVTVRKKVIICDYCQEEISEVEKATNYEHIDDFDLHRFCVIQIVRENLPESSGKEPLA